MEANSTTKAGKFLTFFMKGQAYGIPISTVREINRVSEITPVPQTAPSVAGVMNLRGKVIPVVNLRLKLAFEKIDYTKSTCIIVVEGMTGQVGMIVDSVSGVIDLLDSQMEPPPSFGVQTAEGAFVMGMGKLENQVVILLDIVQCIRLDGVEPLKVPHALAAA